MKKEELINLAKELYEIENIDERKQDLLFLKREYFRINNKEDETFYEKALTNEFNLYFEKLAEKYPELSKSALEEKREIIVKARNLIEKNDNFKNLNKEINTLFIEFKHLPKCSKEQDDEMFDEFKEIKIQANKKIDTHFKEIKASFENRKIKKEEIISKAKKLLESKNMKDAGKEMDILFEEWKKVGFAGKEIDDALWKEFSEVRKEFFTKRKQYFENMKIVIEERANKKQELIKKIKYITSEAYFTPEEIKQIKDIQKEFNDIGFAGKEKDQELYEQMQGAIRKYFEEMKFYK